MSDYVGERSPLRTFGLRSLRRRWKLIAACGALFFVMGLAIAVFKPASYLASIQLLVYVRELQPGPDPVISQGRADLTQVQNEIEIIRSRGMLAKVARSLNLADDSEFAPATTPFRAVMDWLSRGQKAALSESRTKQDLAVESLEKHVSVIRVGTSHTILVNVVTSDPNKSKRIAAAIGEAVLQARVSSDMEGTKSPLLRERLQGLGPNAYVITAAVAPDRPMGPRKSLVVLAMIVIGVVVGSVLALLLDFMNRTIRTAAQVEYLGLECIGIIPRLRLWSRRSAGSPKGSREPDDVEAFRPSPMFEQTVRRALVAIEGAKARTVGVTSAVAGEGAGTVAQHLAQAAARSARNVLLVHVNRSEPSRAMPTADPRPAEVAGPVRAPQGVVRDDRTGLDILETDSLGSADGAAAWWMHCDQNYLGAYDLIVLSLPPLEHGAEFRAAAKNLDGSLLVLKWGATKLERIERAIAVSGAASSEFIGAILNMVDERMIGKFGDQFWKAEAALVGPRRPLEPSMSA